MKLQIVSATGLKPSEIKAVRKLEAQLPNSWVGYASFLMNDGQGTGMEVDLLIITADRFILCEVKEWRGTIRSDGRSWYQSVGLKERQHPSPVAIKREHTQRVRSLLNNAMKSLWGGFYTVDFMIIMAGDALITQMPDNEKSFVMSLDEFSTIGNPELYKQYMPRNYSDYLFTENKLRRPNDTSQIAIFERWMRGGDAISKRYRQESNYMMSSETPIFEQLSYKAYAEYTGEHVQVSGSKALMRLWNFSALGAYASTSSQRANLGLREQRVNLYVQEKNYNLKKDYLMNPLHSYDPEECTEDMIEVFEHSPILKRLDQHLNTLPKTPEARINLMRAVLTPLAELHVIGVAHRDIGFERFWYDAYSKAVIISGLVTARFPEVAGNKSVSDVCSILSSNNISLPEELLGETEIDAVKVDIFQLGVMVYHIAYNQRLEPKSDLLEWITPSNDLFKGLLDQWIQKALEIDPSDRYANAGEMLSALNILLTDSTPTFADDSQIVLAALSDYQQSLNPLSKWPQIGELNNDDERGRMSYTSLVDALPVRVHWWPSLQPQPGQNGNNRRLLQFLKRCQVFKENTLRAPMVVAFGISSMGLFVVQSKIDGYPLDEWLRLIQDREEALDLQFKLSESLIHALNQLHDIGVGHGDLKPDNLFVCGNIYEPVVMLIDCLDIGRSGQMPENHIYAPVLQTTAIERDRYAVYKIIREILPTGNDQTLPVHQEIDRALGIDSQQIPLALEPLRESLTNALLPVEQEPEPLRFWCLGLRDINSGDVLKQDQGRYYLSVKYNEDEKLLRVFIAGLTHQLNLHLALEQNELIIKHAFIKKIPPSELMRSAQAASNSRNNNAQIITHPIQLIESGSNTLLQDLLQQSVVRYALSLDSESSMVVSSELEGRMLPRLWTALLDAEDELNPVVTVNNPLSFDRGAKEWTIPITPRLIELEFDSGSEIQVVEDTERHWVYGDLDTEKSNLKSGFLIVKPSRSNKLFQNIKEDTRLQLVDRQASSSRDRRKKALDRVLNGESLIPDLVQRFDVDAPSVVETIKPIAEPAHDVFRRYSRLDESKAAAFHHVLTQRLSVLMGPPGTGKTTLLAYLLDHLNRQPEIKRVLLVSQSNVAVDEVATQARKVIRELALDEGRDPDQVVPSMVRLGDRAKVNTLLLDIHVDALQSQYRTRFHREFELRLLALSPRLGLQHEFILASAKLYREVGRELYEYVQATRIIIELDAILETKTAKYLIERRDIALIQKKRLSDKLNKQLLAYTDEPEVVLESNNPMNELLHDLGTKHRINNPQQIMKLGELIQLSHDWLSRLATDTTGFASFMAKTRQWIIGTLVGVGKPAYNIKDNQYDIAIIDEAGRASANELAMAMQSARRVVLVGDHLQLPPMYNSAVIKSVAMRLNISKKEVCKTDFERAFKASKGAMLTKQYRMAEPIGNLISHVFYEGKLDTGRPPAADWMAKLATPWEKVVTWIDTSSPQRNENIIDKGVFNKTEVDLICSLLRTLLDSSDGVLDKLRHWAKEDTIPPIGIITGYSKQVSAIQKMMETDSSMMGLRSLVRIDTIDSYQGSENRIVLLSLVRHNMDNQTGFMEDWPRINVALSRAKERLMIIGASQMWVSTNGDSPLGEVYRFIRKKHNEVDPFYRIYTLNELKS